MKCFIRRAVIACIAVLAVTLTRSIGAQSASSRLFLPLNPPASQGSSPTWSDINNHNEIVGGYIDAATGNTVSAIYQDGLFTSFSILGSTFSTFTSVNKSGAAVGFYRGGDGLFHGFVRTSAGVVSALPDVASGGETFPNGINDAGVIVGVYSSGPTEVNEAGFIYKKGVYTTFQYPGSPSSGFRSINNKGVILGNFDDAQGRVHGFMLRVSTSQTTTIDFPGSAQTVVTKINDRGAIIGYYTLDGSLNLVTGVTGSYEGFLLKGNAFTPIEFPNAFNSAPLGINDSGVIVGAYDDFNSSYVAFP